MWVTAPPTGFSHFLPVGEGPRPLVCALLCKWKRLPLESSKPFAVSLVSLACDWLRGGHVTLS